MLNYSPTPSTLNGAMHPVKSTGAPWRMAVLSLVLLGLCILVYAGITFGYTPYMQKQVANADAQIATLTQSLNTQQQNDLMTMYAQLYNIKLLAAQHVKTSKAFTLIEKDTSGAVTYDAMSVTPADGTILLQGSAPDFDTVNAQLAAFQHDTALVTGAVLTSSQTQQQQQNGPQTVSFGIKLNLVKGFFN